MHTLIFNVLVMMLTLLLISCGTEQNPSGKQTGSGDRPQVGSTPKTLETPPPSTCEVSSYGQLPTDFDSSFQVASIKETKAIEGGASLGLQELGIGFLAERSFRVYLPGQADTVQYLYDKTYYVGTGGGLEPLERLPGNPLEGYGQSEILNSPKVGDESRLFRGKSRLTEDSLIYVFRSGDFINVLDYPATIGTQPLIILAEQIDERVKGCQVMTLSPINSLACPMASFVEDLGVAGSWYQSTDFSMHNQVAQLYFLGSQGEAYLTIEVVFEDHESEASWDFELTQTSDWWSGGPPESGWKELPIGAGAGAGLYNYGFFPFGGDYLDFRYEIFAYNGQWVLRISYGHNDESVLTRDQVEGYAARVVEKLVGCPPPRP